MGDRRRSANGKHLNKSLNTHRDPSRAALELAQRSPKVRQGAARPIRNICVYCGSNPGRNPAYMEAACSLGRQMAGDGIGLIYGGGGLGLMGGIAQAVLAGGGRVTGIIPTFLSEREHMLREATELVVVADMHERKRLMFERSDAFVALPGGIGTLEELVEQLTWAQLGRHSKPIVLLNTEGFWEPFVQLLDHLRREAFIRDGMDVHCAVAGTPEAVLAAVHAGAEPTRPGAETVVTEKF
ncbi:MAG: TIGR00730 family Rossman fold protein [Hyphomicrobiaceae bacterium]|nr:TIGR00730 family Rossman fold protein [Hyphomicrobiaceae bacterium]